MEKIKVEVELNITIERAWECFTNPEYVKLWNYAMDTWHCPKAENDLQVGGKFSFTMAAKDGSFSFDFGGEYTEIIHQNLLKYKLGDGREVEVRFAKNDEKITVTEFFDPENQNPEEMQQQGWQLILNNYKSTAESDIVI